MDKWDRMERTFDRVEARFDRMKKLQPMIDGKYDRVAIEEELDALENGTYQYTLFEITLNGEIGVDGITKNPYIIYDKVRYDIEPMYE